MAGIGRSMEVRLEVSHKKANVRRVVLRTDALIGRSSDCNLRVASVGVSRQHCQLLLRDPEVFVRDLKSSNGTFVNGKQIPAEQDVPLKSGSRLAVGPVEFIVRTAGTKPAKEADARKDADQQPAMETPTKSASESADDTLQETMLEQDTLARPVEDEVDETLPEFELDAGDPNPLKESQTVADGDSYRLSTGSEDAAEPSMPADDDDEQFVMEILEESEDDDDAPLLAEPIAEDEPEGTVDSLPLAEPIPDAELAPVPAEPIAPVSSEDEMDDDTRAFLALMDTDDDEAPAEKPDAPPKSEPKPVVEQEETLSEFLKQLEEE